MITLLDLGEHFWRASYGGKEPMLGYETTIERIQWYRDNRPRFAVCADSPRSVRKEQFPTYKVNRPEKPAGAIDALEGIIQRVRDWQVPLVLVDGYEADDVIATLVARAWPEPVEIIGSEKDFYCLIDDDRVTLIGDKGPIDSAACVDKFGVSPSQMTDWLVLVGDSSDNVPGCPGCGMVRATALLKRFRSLSGILAASDEDILAIDGVGKKTLSGLRAFDPEPGRAQILMKEDLPIYPEQVFGKTRSTLEVAVSPRGGGQFSGTFKAPETVGAFTVGIHVTGADDAEFRAAAAAAGEASVGATRVRPPKRNASLLDGGAAAYAAEHAPVPKDAPAATTPAPGPSGAGSAPSRGVDPKAQSASAPSSAGTPAQAVATTPAIAPASSAAAAAAEVVPRSQGSQRVNVQALAMMLAKCDPAWIVANGEDFIEAWSEAQRVAARDWAKACISDGPMALQANRPAHTVLVVDPEEDGR